MYIVSKLIDYATPRVNPNVNCGLWLTIICQCIFMNYNKYTASQVRDVGNKAGCTSVRPRDIKEISALPLHFAVNLKLLLKKKMKSLRICEEREGSKEEQNATRRISLVVVGFPWWLNGKESTCQCRRHRINP